MNNSVRAARILAGLATIACAVAMVLYPETGYRLAGAILSVTLIVSGVRRLGYFATMARHAVGGKSVLYLGAVEFDLGILTGGFTTTPQEVFMLYLLGVRLFSGVVDILRAREARGFDAPWKLTMAQGVLNVAVALACVVFFRSMEAVVYIYCASLVWAAVMNIVSALRPTAIVYIP